MNFPSRAYSLLERIITNSSYFRPFNHCPNLSIKLKKLILPSVSMLFFFGSPPAVFRRIVFGVINSVEGFVFWSFAHITEKISKIIVPAFAHFYPASAISVKIRGIWVVAPSLHKVPRIICSAVRHPMSVVRVILSVLIHGVLYAAR